MEHLGFWGIIKLSMRIILQNSKHFLFFALMCALPYALMSLLVSRGPSIFCRSVRVLVASLSLLYQLSTSQGPLPPSHLTGFHDAIFSQQPPGGHLSRSLLIFFFAFSILISLICSPLVAFSVCRACINKSLDLKGSLRGGLRSAVSLVVTALCVAATFLTFSAAAVLVVLIMSVILVAIDADLAVPMTIWTIGVVGGALHMAIALSLADVVAILEEKRGWEAMRRSVFLMKGNKGTAMALYCGYGALCTVPLFIYCVSEEASVIWRWSGGGASVGLKGFIALFSMVARAVLYMSTKRQLEEPEALSLAIPI